MLDLNYYSECASHESYNVTHPTALGYQKIASEIASMISYIIKTNLNDFKVEPSKTNSHVSITLLNAGST